MRCIKYLIILSFFLNACLNNFESNETNLVGKWEIVFQETRSIVKPKDNVSTDSIPREKGISLETLNTIAETIQSIELNLQSNGTFKLNDLCFLYIDTLIPIKMSGTWKYSRQNQILILQPTKYLEKKFRVKFLSRNKIELTNLESRKNASVFMNTVWKK